MSQRPILFKLEETCGLSITSLPSFDVIVQTYHHSAQTDVLDEVEIKAVVSSLQAGTIVSKQLIDYAGWTMQMNTVSGTLMYSPSHGGKLIGTVSALPIKVNSKGITRVVNTDVYVYETTGYNAHMIAGNNLMNKLRSKVEFYIGGPEVTLL